MAKTALGFKFNNATLYKEGDEWFLTEIARDDAVDTNLSHLLEKLVSYPGLSISIQWTGEYHDGTQLATAPEEESDAMGEGGFDCPTCRMPD